MSKENQKNKINRDQRIAIRLTEKELNIIKKKAEKMSITSSEMFVTKLNLMLLKIFFMNLEE